MLLLPPRGGDGLRALLTQWGGVHMKGFSAHSPQHEKWKRQGMLTWETLLVYSYWPQGSFDAILGFLEIFQ